MLNRARLILFFCTLATSAFSQTYYVSNSGNDLNNGLSASAPLRTFAQLLAKDPVNGSVINLERGSTWHEELYLEFKNNITVKAYGSGERPVADASDVMDESWIPYAAGVWYRNIAIPTGVNQQPGVWDNSTGGNIPAHLRLALSIPTKNTPGMFYYGGGRLYVSTYGGIAPAKDQLSVSIRNFAVILGANALVDGITTKRNLYNDGSLKVGIKSVIRNCAALDGSKHNMLIGSGLVEDCEVYGQGHPDDYGGAYSSIGFFFTDNHGDTAMLRRVKATYTWGGNANGTLTTAHATLGGYFALIDIQDTEASGFGGIYGNLPDKIIQKNNIFTDCRLILFAGVDTIISINNVFKQTSASLWGYNLPFQIYSSRTNFTSINDLFYGTPNTGMGFITVSDGGIGSTITLRNPRFTVTDSAEGKAIMRFDCPVTLDMTGCTFSGGSSSMLCITGPPGMAYRLTDNIYPAKRTFAIEGFRTDLYTWKVMSGQDINALTYQKITSLQGPDTLQGPWMITTQDDSVRIKVNAGISSPAFSGAASAYTGTVPRSVSVITTTPALEDITAVVKVNEKIVAGGAASQQVLLKGGDNIINTTVAGGDGIVRRYTMTITRISDKLSALGVSEGSLSPSFLPEIQSYIVTVSNATTFFSVSPVAEDTNAIVKVNGIITPVGKPSQTISLNAGVNKIIVTVTAQDGIVKTYTVMVTRLPDSRSFTFQTYPNPSTGSFSVNVQVEKSMAGVINLTIINPAGNFAEPPKKVSFSGNAISIPVNATGLAPGIYIVAVEVNGEKVIRRQIVF